MIGNDFRIYDTEMKRIAIITASGKGLRMNNPIPKQYIKLDNGLTVIDTTITQLLKTPFFDQVLVVLDPNDHYWPQSIYSRNKKILVCSGGKARSDSVRNGLLSLKNTLDDDDWVFVHDAVRPFIQLDDIRRLYASVVVEKSIGGILACPAIETIKQANTSQNVAKTLMREHIYLAQTPQVFRYKTLLMGYYFCLHNNITVTDESSAVEALDHQPIIIQGDRKNIKITSQEDILLANYFLSLDQ